MGDLGDLGDFLKEGALADLSWLDVDEKKYREADRLPMQNLDIAPDMEALWAHEDKPASSYKEKDNLPQTMGDMSQAHGHLRASPADIVRTMKFAMMQSPDLMRIRDAVTSRYDSTSIAQARTAMAAVLAERGLLGGFYVDAFDFPGCKNSSKKTVDFVRRYAGNAPFLLAKTDCSGCIHATANVTGRTHCSVFHKEIVVDIPFSDAVADHVENIERAKGKVVQAASLDMSPKERIRRALLAELGTNHDQHASTPKPIVNPAQFMKDTVAPMPVMARVDLSRQREIAKVAVSQALGVGSLSLVQARQAFVQIAHANDEDTLIEITAVASGQEAPLRKVYVGAGEGLAPASIPAAEMDAKIISASNLTKKRDEAIKASLAEHKARPIVALLRRELLKGRSESELGEALKLGFEMSVLMETRPYWEPMFREAGLYGTVYVTQESFDECREGSDFLAKHGSSTRAVIAGPKCTGCIYNKIAFCHLYGKKLVKEASEIVNWETVETVLQNHKNAGNIPAWEAHVAAFGQQTPGETLKAIHRKASVKPGYAVAGARMDGQMAAFRGAGETNITTSGMTRRDIVKTASRYLNEGLYGRDLLHALKSRFDPRDLTAATNDLRTVIAEQGLQGIYFVDPTIYDDYGKGCDEPARLFRAKGVPYVKVGPKCGSCVLQSQSGICSKINKPLVVEPPYLDKQAQQREILASGNATETSYANLQSGASMMVEYQMQNGGMENIQLNASAAPISVAVQFNDVSGIKL